MGEVILDGRRSAANGAPTLTESAYDSWRIDNGNVTAPASWAVRYRFGTWVHACEAAGLSAATGWREVGDGDEALLSALRRVHEQIVEPPSEQLLEPRHLGSLRTAIASGLQLRIPVDTDRACNQSLIGSAHGPMLVIR